MLSFNRVVFHCVHIHAYIHTYTYTPQSLNTLICYRKLGLFANFYYRGYSKHKSMNIFSKFHLGLLGQMPRRGITGLYRINLFCKASRLFFIETEPDGIYIIRMFSRCISCTYMLSMYTLHVTAHLSSEKIVWILSHPYTNIFNIFPFSTRKESLNLLQELLIVVLIF